MFEALSMIVGALICILFVKMFFVLWDNTDWYGRCLAMGGLLSAEAAVCYFGITVNNYLYFGFGIMSVIVFFAIVPLSTVRTLKKRRKRDNNRSRRLNHG